MKKTTFRHDMHLHFVYIAMLLAFLICSVTMGESRKNNIVFRWLITIPLISNLFSVVNSTTISSEEITVTNWRGRQTLSWDEITGTSLHFFELRLYSSTRNKMLALDLTVLGYETILETIMQRRSDLFRNHNDFIVSHREFIPPYWGTFVTLIFVLISIYSGTSYWIPILICYIIFQIILLFFVTPEIHITKNTIYLKRPLQTKSYTTNEVGSISSKKRFTRLGKSYTVSQLHLKNGKTIEVEAGCIGPFVYQQLVNWHTTYSE